MIRWLDGGGGAGGAHLLLLLGIVVSDFSDALFVAEFVVSGVGGSNSWAPGGEFSGFFGGFLLRRAVVLWFLSGIGCAAGWWRL